MTNAWRNYHAPQSVDVAIDLLQHYDGGARVIGGGTDYLVETRRGLHRPVDAIIDATRIAGLDGIAEEDGYIVIGCGVTHSRIVADQGIRAHASCLAESCGVIGGPQVRNVGTLAGNVAHALPAGDGTIGLLALDGEIEVASASGSRWIPARESFVGPGRSVIDRRNEVLTRLRFRPTGEREGSAHHRVMRPQGLCLPIISTAARVRLDAAGKIEGATISMGPVGPVPWVAEPAMAVLQGRPPTRERFDEAAEAVIAAVTLRTSKYRATSEYRQSMIRTYLPLILARAVERAGGVS
ncbi:MAG: FAD binding domain-containing protein [Gammaproteobacteria bacterium]|nr:FAD binding domain-containing protein [Gammaproteobacteria bacterium]